MKETLYLVTQISIVELTNHLKKISVLDENYNWLVFNTTLLLTNKNFEKFEMDFFLALDSSGRSHNNKVRILKTIPEKSDLLSYQDLMNNNGKWNFFKKKVPSIFINNHFLFLNWLFLDDTKIKEKDDVYLWLSLQMSNTQDSNFWTNILRNTDLCDLKNYVHVEKVDNVYVCFAPTKVVRTDFCNQKVAYLDVTPNPDINQSIIKFS